MAIFFCLESVSHVIEVAGNELNVPSYVGSCQSLEAVYTFCALFNTEYRRFCECYSKVERLVDIHIMFVQLCF